MSLPSARAELSGLVLGCSAGELRSAPSWRDAQASGPLRLVCQRLAPARDDRRARAHAAPLGQTIPVRRQMLPQRGLPAVVMRVSSGPQFSVFARTRGPSGRTEPSGPRLFDPFTARDDQGNSYQVSIRDIGSPVLGWTLMVRSNPRHDPRWLDLATGDGPAARIILSSSACKTRPPYAPDVMVSQSASSPGEQLLNTIAARLLAAVPALPHDPWLYPTGRRPTALTSIADGLGDVMAALLACGALSPLTRSRASSLRCARA